MFVSWQPTLSAFDTQIVQVDYTLHQIWASTSMLPHEDLTDWIDWKPEWYLKVVLTNIKWWDIEPRCQILIFSYGQDTLKSQAKNFEPP